jgi:hypothetical protein
MQVIMALLIPERSVGKKTFEKREGMRGVSRRIGNPEGSPELPPVGSGSFTIVTYEIKIPAKRRIKVYMNAGPGIFLKLF